MCNDDWNIDHRRWSEKMFSWRGPNFLKKSLWFALCAQILWNWPLATNIQKNCSGECDLENLEIYFESKALPKPPNPGQFAIPYTVLKFRQRNFHNFFDCAKQSLKPSFLLPFIHPTWPTAKSQAMLNLNFWTKLLATVQNLVRFI